MSSNAAEDELEHQEEPLTKLLMDFLEEHNFLPLVRADLKVLAYEIAKSHSMAKLSELDGKNEIIGALVLQLLKECNLERTAKMLELETGLTPEAAEDIYESNFHGENAVNLICSLVNE